MLDPAVLMRRAVRWVCDTNGVTINQVTNFSGSIKSQFQDLVITVRDDMEFNQLRYFRPFEHQLKFFTTNQTDRRGILAANRIGKTVSTCYETAYHLTGLYPVWWIGKRFDKPITCMVAGEGWSQVALVLLFWIVLLPFKRQLNQQKQLGIQTWHQWEDFCQTH